MNIMKLEKIIYVYMRTDELPILNNNRNLHIYQSIYLFSFNLCP